MAISYVSTHRAVSVLTQHLYCFSYLLLVWWQYSEWLDAIAGGSIPRTAIIGVSPSGKALDFDSSIRWFKSNYPS